MARLNGLYSTRMALLLEKAISKTSGKVIKDYLDGMIRHQKDADGKTLPTKKESTKAIYNKQGWNTELWFVRKNEAAQWKERRIKGGISITPGVPRRLEYVERIDKFFVLNAKVQEDLKEALVDYLKRKI